MPMPSLISLAFKGCEPLRFNAHVQVISASTPPSRRCHSPVALASRYEVTSMRFPRLGVISSTATCSHYDRGSGDLGLYAAEQALPQTSRHRFTVRCYLLAFHALAFAGFFVVDTT